MIEAIRQKPQILVRVNDSGSDYWDGTPEQEPICPKGIGLFPIYRRTRQSLRKLNNLVEVGLFHFHLPTWWTVIASMVGNLSKFFPRISVQEVLSLRIRDSWPVAGPSGCSWVVLRSQKWKLTLYLSCNMDLLWDVWCITFLDLTLRRDVDAESKLSLGSLALGTQDPWFPLLSAIVHAVLYRCFEVSWEIKWTLGD